MKENVPLSIEYVQFSSINIYRNHVICSLENKYIGWFNFFKSFDFNQYFTVFLSPSLGCYSSNYTNIATMESLTEILSYIRRLIGTYIGIVPANVQLHSTETLITLKLSFGVITSF